LHLEPRKSFKSIFALVFFFLTQRGGTDARRCGREGLGRQEGSRSPLTRRGRGEQATARRRGREGSIVAVGGEQAAAVGARVRGSRRRCSESPWALSREALEVAVLGSRGWEGQATAVARSSVTPLHAAGVERLGRVPEEQMGKRPAYFETWGGTRLSKRCARPAFLAMAIPQRGAISNPFGGFISLISLII
jgi:hypothetical protein